MLGIINAAFSIGAVLALPIVPYVRPSRLAPTPVADGGRATNVGQTHKRQTNDRVGRKHSITIGSAIILAGVILQTASVNSQSLLLLSPRQDDEGRC